jgi:predicted ribosome quality control (RQC) complex YloA/Tae2 family protein
MASPARLPSAVKSLTAALDLLDAAVQRREQAEAARRDLVDELAVMQDDRARLAEELDACLDRAERLAAAAHAVGAKLDRMDGVCAGLLADMRPAAPAEA